MTYKINYINKKTLNIFWEIKNKLYYGRTKGNCISHLMVPPVSHDVKKSSKQAEPIIKNSRLSIWFDFISNTIQAQAYQQTRLQAQILFILAYIVLHFHVSYMCNLYMGIFFFFFFWLMKLYTEILCANESDTTYIYSIQYKWEVEVSFEPKAIDIITRTLLTFFFFFD